MLESQENNSNSNKSSCNLCEIHRQAKSCIAWWVKERSEYKKAIYRVLNVQNFRKKKLFTWKVLVDIMLQLLLLLTRTYQCSRWILINLFRIKIHQWYCPRKRSKMSLTQLWIIIIIIMESQILGVQQMHLGVRDSRTQYLISRRTKRFMRKLREEKLNPLLVKKFRRIKMISLLITNSKTCSSWK